MQFLSRAKASTHCNRTSVQAAQKGMLQSMQTFHDTVKISFIQLAGRSMTLLVVDFGGILEGLHDLLHALLCCLHRCQVGLRHFDALALLGYRSPVHCILATHNRSDKCISELAECGSMTQKQGGTSKAKGTRKAARLPSCCWGKGGWVSCERKLRRRTAHCISAVMLVLGACLTNSIAIGC